VALLLAAVLSPFAVSCAPIAWTHELETLDFVLNVLFFVPVAGLIGPKHRLRAIILGFALSLAIELAQRHLFRSPNVWDLLANTLGAGLGTVLPLRRLERALRGISVRTAAVILTIVSLAGAEGLVWLADQTPNASFDTWTDMPLVLGCEQDTKPSFQGVIRGLAVYDQALKAPPVGNLSRLNDERAPVYAIDFTQQRAWLGQAQTEHPLALSPPPGVEVSQDGLHLREGCWFLDDRSAAHVKARLQATNRLSVALEVKMPPNPEPKRARVFALTQLHSTWNFSVGHLGERLIFWLRLGTIPDAFEDPLGETGLLPVAPGAEGVATFTVDEARLRGFWNGECRRERLYVLLGRPFLAGRGLGFSLAVLAALASLTAALSFRRRRFAALVSAPLMLGWLWGRGVLQPLEVLQWNLLALGLLGGLAVLVAVILFEAE
jgi:hypothetical protein